VTMDLPDSQMQGGFFNNWFRRPDPVPTHQVTINHPGPQGGGGFSQYQAEQVARDLHSILMLLQYQQAPALPRPPMYNPAAVPPPPGYSPPYNPNAYGPPQPEYQPGYGPPPPGYAPE